MKKNVLIVNFNTQKLTDACIASINKCTKDCTIYVFDNSDKEQFINTFNNVSVIDNVNGKIVNFNDILDRHKDFVDDKALNNNYGSFKHCLSIDVAMDIIEDGFVLMDSDVLIKKDFTPLFDETKVYVGNIERMPHFTPRVAPFLCYINIKMCKENGIRYFDENHMFGFYDAQGGKNYDTGCWFYEACENLPKKEISITPYMVHFRAASWYKEATEHGYKKMTPERWLEMNRRYWKDDKPVLKQVEKKEEPVKEEPKEFPVKVPIKKPPVVRPRKITFTRRIVR